jgi:hypothetical protein
MKIWLNTFNSCAPSLCKYLQAKWKTSFLQGWGHIESRFSQILLIKFIRPGSGRILLFRHGCVC